MDPQIKMIIDQVNALKEQMNSLDRRVHQSDIPQGTIKARHIEQQQMWQSPVYENSWVDYDTEFSPGGYYKDSLNNIHLRGLIKGGTFPTTAFTLPEGYRPEYRALFTTISNGAIGRIDIYPNGAVTAFAGNATYFSLEGVSFRAYQ